jgi:hypothetical protein
LKIYNVEITCPLKISESNAFKLRILIWIHYDVFSGINFSQRFTDVKARDPVGASNLKANPRSHAPNHFLKKIPLRRRNSGLKGTIFSVFGRNGAVRQD